MPDEPTPGQEPTPSGQEPQSPPSPAPTPTGQEPKGESPERYDAEYVKELRRSEAATRKRLQDLEARVKADEDAKLSEHERLTKRAAELEAQLRERDAAVARMAWQQAVEREARGLGFADPADAHLFLADEAQDADEHGAYPRLRRALETVLTAKPYLKGHANGTTGVPATPRAAGAPTRAQAVEQTQQELQATGLFGRF